MLKKIYLEPCSPLATPTGSRTLQSIICLKKQEEKKKKRPNTIQARRQANDTLKEGRRSAGVPALLALIRPCDGLGVEGRATAAAQRGTVGLLG
jgi:hypothetical protein